MTPAFVFGALVGPGERVTPVSQLQTRSRNRARRSPTGPWATSESSSRIKKKELWYQLVTPLRQVHHGLPQSGGGTSKGVARARFGPARRRGRCSLASTPFGPAKGWGMWSGTTVSESVVGNTQPTEVVRAPSGEGQALVSTQLSLDNAQFDESRSGAG